MKKSAHSVMDQHAEDQPNADECSKYCKRKCRASFSTWTEECIDSLKTEFHRRTLIEKKNAVLSHLIKQDAMGIKKRGILWNSELLCTKFFSKISSISPYIIDLVVSDYFKEGVRQYTHGNTGCSKQRPASVRFTAWMVNHVEIFGQDAPDELTKIMSSTFRKR